VCSSDLGARIFPSVEFLERLTTLQFPLLWRRIA
jgi:hypothetical protein